MKKQDISKLSVEDLKKQVASRKEALAKTKIGHGISPIENPLSIRIERREIARLITELNKRESQSVA